jgi:hypothetical protein
MFNGALMAEWKDALRMVDKVLPDDGSAFNLLSLRSNADDKKQEED